MTDAIKIDLFLVEKPMKRAPFITGTLRTLRQFYYACYNIICKNYLYPPIKPVNLSYPINDIKNVWKD